MAIISATNLGTGLSQLLMCDEIMPGAEPSYQLAKTIYTYHPLGAKMAKGPIQMAQSQERTISIATAPDEVRNEFVAAWKKMQASIHIRNVMTMARVYGIASVAAMVQDDDVGEALDRKTFWQKTITFNVFDPLNTAGSMVLNLDPLAADFLKPRGIAVSGKSFHHTRTCAILNEEPVYLAYTTSAFGFVGRSVYQRPLFPLKSFINTMRADDMVSRKAGLLVAKMKQPGSIIDNAMQTLFGQKRQLLKEAETSQVLGIDTDEAIETLNMQNVNNAMDASRSNILKNIAVGADMPAKLLDNETFVEGFGEGTEDAKNIARYIDGVRIEMQPLYDFFDDLVRLKAWNPDFYKVIQKKYPEYEKVSYDEAFYSWKNAFTAEWPSLLKEPESEAIKVADVQLKAIIALVQVLLPNLDPMNQTAVIRWAADNFNNLTLLFQNELVLEYDDLEVWAVDQAERAAEQGQSGDGEGGEEDDVKVRLGRSDRAAGALKSYDSSVTDLLDVLSKREKVVRRSLLAAQEA